MRSAGVVSPSPRRTRSGPEGRRAKLITACEEDPPGQRAAAWAAGSHRRQRVAAGSTGRQRRHRAAAQAPTIIVQQLHSPRPARCIVARRRAMSAHRAAAGSSGLHRAAAPTPGGRARHRAAAPTPAIIAQVLRSLSSHSRRSRSAEGDSRRMATGARVPYH